MRKTILVAVAAFVAGAIGAGAALSLAQPPIPPGSASEVLPSPGRMTAMGPHGPGGRPGHMGGPIGRLRNFALVFRQDDRALSPADVQKMAEAFLLWHGNHSWKVTDVAPTADGLVAFNIASPDGFVIAKFTMDPHTAQVIRVS